MPSVDLACGSRAVVSTLPPVQVVQSPPGGVCGIAGGVRSRRDVPPIGEVEQGGVGTALGGKLSNQRSYCRRVGDVCRTELALPKDLNAQRSGVRLIWVRRTAQHESHRQECPDHQAPGTTIHSPKLPFTVAFWPSRNQRPATTTTRPVQKPNGTDEQDRYRLRRQGRRPTRHGTFFPVLRPR